MSIFSLLPDILPMILPSAVHVTKAEDLEASRATSSNSGMVRQGAIVGKSDKMCATVLTAKPRCASAVHHHGEQDTIIYAASGTGILMTNPDNDGELKKHELSPGGLRLRPALDGAPGSQRHGRRRGLDPDPQRPDASGLLSHGLGR
ncbi:hypothetical protein PG987_015509 [Apiospora arundinis]